ncbi:MAG: DUF72 domain-containing protein [Planctomycetota bacterium]|jgi:uncharacterized protein YecE (DUF72 family)
MRKARFIFGTAGWSYKDWVGPFYPAGTAARDYLRHYARTFPGVEIDGSPKMVREVTHERFLEDCEEPVAAFLEALEPLDARLGPILLQFRYFRKAEGITLPKFLDRLLPFLDGLPKGPQFAVEVRNKTYLKPDLLGALRERDVALVLVDHAWMPSPQQYLEEEELFTADFVPIRLLGDRVAIEKITKSWASVVVERTPRLRAWAEVIRAALASGREVTAFANNHYAGYGPATALLLAELVGDVPLVTRKGARGPSKRKGKKS